MLTAVITDFDYPHFSLYDLAWNPTQNSDCIRCKAKGNKNCKYLFCGLIYPLPIE